LSEIAYVDVQGVTRSFGGRPVLRGVSARFDRSTITFVEGPNGAGKSTLLGVLGMALVPTAGTVNYHPFGGDPQTARRILGWLSHETRAYRDLSGRENIALAARLHGVPPEAGFDRVAAPLGLADFADQRVGTLSRGQRQRIALARAVVHAPSVILLDEPMTGLDHESSERVLQWLELERERGAVVIVVSHVAGLPERLGARRLRLERGRVVRDSRT
jgi:heme exporter protein A